MRYRVLILETARQDLHRIEKYISEVLLNPVSAEKIKRDILRAIKSLEYMPARSRLGGGYYKIRVKRFKIFYKITGKTVKILAIRHCSQNYAIPV